MFAKGGDKAKAKREERARAKAAKKGVSEGDLFTPEPTIEGEGSNSKSDTKQSTSNPAPLTTTNKGKQQPSPGYFHTVPSLPPSLPTASTINDKVSTIPNPLFPFPTTPQQRANLQTFTSLPPSLPTASTSKSISTIPNHLFPFPQTQQQSANLQTFSSLSSLSYRMGLGPRFGGEYLIYPGDYLRYHAHFTSQVVLHDGYIKPMEIVAWGRLGTGTKKAGLICCVTDERSELDTPDKKERGDRIRASEDEVDHEQVHDEEKGGVEFYSLEWANFG
jgi:tRNA-splicing endonuclease subunit Sen34